MTIKKLQQNSNFQMLIKEALLVKTLMVNNIAKLQST